MRQQRKKERNGCTVRKRKACGMICVIHREFMNVGDILQPTIMM